MAKQVDPAALAGAVPDSADAHGRSWPRRITQLVQPRAPAQARSPPPGPRVAQLGPYPAFHGRRVSWVAVSIIMAGFLIGGLAMVFGHHGPVWWLFWTGAGISVLGLLASMATNTFEDWY